MAIIKCSECGNKVSNKAISCPTCGNQVAKEIKDELAHKLMMQNPPKDNTLSTIFWFCVFILGVVVVFHAPSQRTYWNGMAMAISGFIIWLWKWAG